MKKILSLLLVPLVLGSLTSCDFDFFGHQLTNYKGTEYAENDDYIVFIDMVYKKSDESYAPLLDEIGSLYRCDGVPSFTLNADSFIVSWHNEGKLHTDTFQYDGRISESKTEDYEGEEFLKLMENYYFENTVRDPDYDALPISDVERIIWDYSKTKSLKDSYPYWIVINCVETADNIKFSVNVYDKVMWQRQYVINEGIVSSTLNIYDKKTKKISELYSYEEKAIMNFFDNHVYYYQKSDDSIYAINLTTYETTNVSKFNDFYWYITSDKYCRIEDASDMKKITVKLVEVK